jgi:hypothetical protein
LIAKLLLQPEGKQMLTNLAQQELEEISEPEETNSRPLRNSKFSSELLNQLAYQFDKADASRVNANKGQPKPKPNVNMGQSKTKPGAAVDEPEAEPPNIGGEVEDASAEDYYYCPPTPAKSVTLNVTKKEKYKGKQKEKTPAKQQEKAARKKAQKVIIREEDEVDDENKEQQEIDKLLVEEKKEQQAS